MLKCRGEQLATRFPLKLWKVMIMLVCAAPRLKAGGKNWKGEKYLAELSILKRDVNLHLGQGRGRVIHRAGAKLVWVREPELPLTAQF